MSEIRTMYIYIYMKIYECTKKYTKNYFRISYPYNTIRIANTSDVLYYIPEEN